MELSHIIPPHSARRYRHLPRISPASWSVQTERHAFINPGSNPACMCRLGMKTVGNGRKTSQPFSTSTFEYENENESGKAGHKNEHELTEYQKFQKRTNSSEIMSNTVGIRKINTEY